MEIVNIEAQTFEVLIGKFEIFIGKLKRLCEIHEDKGEKKWLTAQEVCLILGVSLRTLQSYRNNRILPYSQIRNKIYYKPADVENLIDQNRHCDGK